MLYCDVMTDSDYKQVFMSMNKYKTMKKLLEIMFL